MTNDTEVVTTAQAPATRQAAEVGVHTDMPGAVPPQVSKAVATGSPAPAGLTDEEWRALQKLSTWLAGLNKSSGA
jgi:hypothetical protein